MWGIPGGPWSDRSCVAPANPGRAERARVKAAEAMTRFTGGTFHPELRDMSALSHLFYTNFAVSARCYCGFNTLTRSLSTRSSVLRLPFGTPVPSASTRPWSIGSIAATRVRGRPDAAGPAVPGPAGGHRVDGPARLRRPDPGADPGDGPRFGHVDGRARGGGGSRGPRPARPRWSGAGPDLHPGRRRPRSAARRRLVPSGGLRLRQRRVGRSHHPGAGQPLGLHRRSRSTTASPPSIRTRPPATTPGRR